MARFYSILLLSFCFIGFCYSQIDEIFLDPDLQHSDSVQTGYMLDQEEINEYIQSLPHKQNETVLGGFVSSIFHESIDSARIIVRLDNKDIDSTYSNNGLFNIVKNFRGHILDINISHPDYHDYDTSLIITGSGNIIISCALEPKYKILLRGRVYAGNMPLEGVDVEIKHIDRYFRMKTKGCYYDKEDYWNCLYDGMFKFDITTDNPDDSIVISLKKEGMKPLQYNMVINEYKGEVMDFKMKYESDLPVIPLNSVNLRLGFPFLSAQSDWFVSLSYYRLVNRDGLRRIGYGVDGNLYVSAITVSHSTFPGLPAAKADSSYLNGFIGPSCLFWIIPPEKRKLSSYAGITFAVNISNPELTFEPFAGTRVFLDMNKAISLELRYTEFNTDIVHYTFNPYGNANAYKEREHLLKLHASLGIQIAF